MARKNELDPRELVIRNLREARRASGMSQSEMAEALGFTGANARDRYAKYETRSVIPLQYAARAANVLKIPLRALVPVDSELFEIKKDEKTGKPTSLPKPILPEALDEALAALEEMQPNARLAPDAPMLPHFTEMSRTIPVLGTAECGPDGEFEMNSGETIDYVRRPPALVGNKRAFAVYAQGTSMEPMYYAGDPVFVDPNRPPVVGRPVLVELRQLSDHENPRGFLKILTKYNSEFVDLRQLNPDNSHKPARIMRKAIKGLYRVLTNQDLLGI